MANNAITILKTSLEKMSPKFAESLPKQIPTHRFIRTMMMAVSDNPEIADCDRNSVYSACMKAAQDGLILDGREAALVSFSSKGQKYAQYMPMVSGIIKKCRNSGELSTIGAQVVRDGDEFEYWIDEDGEHLRHKPELMSSGDAKLVYAIAKLKDGSVMIEVMTKSDVEKIRDVSRSGKSEHSPWNKWWDEMAKKSAIRRLAKRLPMSTDLANVIMEDDRDYSFNSQDDNIPQQKEKKQSVAESVILEGEVVDDII